MFQHLVEPATAVNMIVFRAFGILRGCVTLRGEFEVHVPDGRIGALVRRSSACFSSAVAP